MASCEAELYCEQDCELAEGPVWFGDKLWWVDIEAGRLLHDGGEVFQAPFAIGAAVPQGDGSWILADEQGFSRWNLENTPRSLWKHPRADDKTLRFNDGKRSPAGNVWAGTLDRKTLQGTNALFRLDANGNVTVLAEDIALSNGLAWDERRQRFYLSDTGAGVVCLWDYNETEDSIAHRRVAFSCDDGHPDGMCIDEEGRLWIAVWGAGEVRCYEPDTGEIVARVEVPVPQVSSCCFGEGGLLYITTAWQGMSEEERAQYPLSGSIFIAKI